MSSGDDERGILGNEGSDVSTEGVGTNKNPQPAVILVLDPSIQDELVLYFTKIYILLIL